MKTPWWKIFPRRAVRSSARSRLRQWRSASFDVRRLADSRVEREDEAGRFEKHASERIEVGKRRFSG